MAGNAGSENPDDETLEEEVYFVGRYNSQKQNDIQVLDDHIHSLPH